MYPYESSSAHSSPADSLLESPRYAGSLTTTGTSCAFPSWPSGLSLNAPPEDSSSAYIDDLELFPTENTSTNSVLEDPPREFSTMWFMEQAGMLKAKQVDLYAPQPPKPKRRRSSSKKVPTLPQILSQIEESPR